MPDKPVYAASTPAGISSNPNHPEALTNYSLPKAFPTDTRTVAGSIATVSWVHSKCQAGRFIKDQTPPEGVTGEFLVKPKNYRISNLLNCFLQVSAVGEVTNYGFYDNSGLYRGHSYLKLPTQSYRVLQRAFPIRHEGIAGVEFDQLVGARTMSATFIGAVVGSIVGVVVGFFLGAYLVNRLRNFPPIWTHLRFQLLGDGQQAAWLIGHSLFPCNTLYQRLEDGVYRAKCTYEARQPQQVDWYCGGWEANNPWGIPRPSIGLFSIKYK